MAKSKKTRKQYRGRDSSLPPQTIRVEAKQKNGLQIWWEDNKSTVMIRLVQLGLVLVLYVLVRLVWSLLS